MHKPFLRTYFSDILWLSLAQTISASSNLAYISNNFFKCFTLFALITFEKPSVMSNCAVSLFSHTPSIVSWKVVGLSLNLQNPLKNRAQPVKFPGVTIKVNDSLVGAVKFCDHYQFRREQNRVLIYICLPYLHQQSFNIFLTTISHSWTFQISFFMTTSSNILRCKTILTDLPFLIITKAGLTKQFTVKSSEFPKSTLLINLAIF